MYFLLLPMSNFYVLKFEHKRSRADGTDSSPAVKKPACCYDR